MDPWLIALVIKPLAALLCFAAFYALLKFAHVLAWLVKPLVPDGYWKTYLFTNDPLPGDASEPANPCEGRFEHLPITRRHGSQ